jgi:hypothetical protein
VVALCFPVVVVSVVELVVVIVTYDLKSRLQRRGVL